MNFEANQTIPYRPNSNKLMQLFVAGFIGIVTMTALAYLLRAFGISAPDFAAEYGAILNEQTYPVSGSALWWVGLGWHFINGTFIFSLLYDYLGDRRVLKGERSVKGLLYGVGIWLLISVIIAPMAGEGLFFRYMAQPAMMAVTALVGWLTYGLVLDSMTRVRVVHELHVSEIDRNRDDDRMAA